MAENNNSPYATFTEDDLKMMSFLEYDLTNYVYDMPALSSNAFYVAQFGECPSYPEDNYRTFDNAMFRIHGIEFPLPSIEYEEHNELNMELLKAVKYSKSVSLYWLEDAYRSVQKYHLDWLTHFYNKKGDYLVNGARGKFRNCEVVLFHLRARQGGVGLAELTPVVEPIMKLEIRGMQVKNFGDLSVKFGSPKAEELQKIDYSIISCNLKYNAAYNIAGEGQMAGRNKATTVAKEHNVLWAPLTETDSGASPELMRLGLSFTKTLNGEGLIG